MYFSYLIEDVSEFHQLFNDVFDSKKLERLSSQPDANEAIQKYYDDGLRLINQKLQDTNFAGGSSAYGNFLNSLNNHSELPDEIKSSLRTVVTRHADAYNKEHPFENFVYQNREYMPAARVVVPAVTAGIAGGLTYKWLKKRKE